MTDQTTADLRAQTLRDAAEMVEQIQSESTNPACLRALQAYQRSIVTALRIAARLAESSPADAAPAPGDGAQPDARQEALQAAADPAASLALLRRFGGGSPTGTTPLLRGRTDTPRRAPMTDWTDADVELVTRALADACPTPDQCADYHDECLQQHGVHWTAVGPGGVGPQYITVLEGDPRTLSRIALSALAAAGRDYTAGVADGRRLAAEEIAAACAAEYDRLARTAIRCHRTGDTAEARRVAAQQRVWRAASDLAREHAERTTR